MLPATMKQNRERTLDLAVAWDPALASPRTPRRANPARRESCAADWQCPRWSRRFAIRRLDSFAAGRSSEEDRAGLGVSALSEFVVLRDALKSLDRQSKGRSPECPGWL